MATDATALAALEAEAKYARDKLRLYEARAHTGRAYDPTRLRELERVATGAAERLAFARSEAAGG